MGKPRSMKANAVKLSAHLYNGDIARVINIPVMLTRVPTVGEFLFAELETAHRDTLLIFDGEGDMRPFEVVAVDHIDLNAEVEFEAEAWCSYVTIEQHGKSSAFAAAKHASKPRLNF